MLDVFSPFAIQLTENFGIRWYGLAYLIGFIATYYVALIVLKNDPSRPSKDLIADFIFTAAVGTVIGGRLGYCLFYQPSLFTEFSSNPPFWGALAIQEGGMASHGGMIGIVSACYYFAKKKNLNPLRLMDVTVLGGCIGVFLGRIANFVNGELYGRITDVTWGMRFPREIMTWEQSELTKITPLLSAITPRPTSLSALVEASITAARNGNEAVIQTLNAILPLRHPSQLYEAGLEGLLVGILLLIVYRLSAAKPGECTKWFFIFYGIARIIGEQFRMPDIQIGYEAFGLTRGQILSIGLILVGIFWKAFDRSKKAQTS